MTGSDHDPLRWGPRRRVDAVEIVDDESTDAVNGLRIGTADLPCQELDRNSIRFADVAPTVISEMQQALRKLSVDDPEARFWLVEMADARIVLLHLDFDSNELTAVVGSGLKLWSGEPHALEVVIPDLIAAVLARWDATAMLDDDPATADRRTVHVRIADTTRQCGDLLQCAAEIDALLLASRGGHVSMEVARDLIMGGLAGALLGVKEGHWLDAKGAPYLDSARESFELAKDVAAFANADGGLILLPATTRHDGLTETIAAIGEVPRSLVDVRSWQDRIAERVYPQPAGVTVDWVGTNDRGQVLIYVPPQTEARKPFLVRGAVEGTRVLAHAITVPWRDGDRTRFDEIGAVHAALSAHRRVRDSADAVADHVYLASLPLGFQRVVEVAREAGLQVGLHRDGFSISSLDGHRVDVGASDLHPMLELLSITSVMQRLAAFGVPARRTARGFLVPEGWSTGPPD